MKLNLITAILIIWNLSAIGQNRSLKPNIPPAIASKLKAIDSCVAVTNKRTDLDTVIHSNILLDNTEESETIYLDRKTHQYCKIIEGTKTIYYRNNRLAYTETNDSSPVNKTYYDENGKILYTTYHLNTEKILGITYRQNIGNYKVGEVTYLSINRDSMFYSSRRHGKLVQHTRKKNSMKNWLKLIHMVKLADFEKVNSGKSEMPVDGVDNLIEIRSDHHTFSVLNGQVDTINYKKIAPFANALTDMAHKQGN